VKRSPKGRATKGEVIDLVSSSDSSSGDPEVSTSALACLSNNVSKHGWGRLLGP